MMTTYPDIDDMTAAKHGSDHDRAEAWRIMAQDMRAERDAERLRADGLDHELAVAKHLYATKCDQHMTEHTARLQAEAENERLRETLKRIDHIVFDVPRTGDPNSAVMDIARVIAEHVSSATCPGDAGKVDR